MINMDTLFKWAKRHKATGLTATQLLSFFLALYKANSLDIVVDYKPYLDSLPETFDEHPLTAVVLHEQNGSLNGRLPVEVATMLNSLHARFNFDVGKMRELSVSGYIA